MKCHENLKNKKPTRCHLLYCASYRLNMFRALVFDKELLIWRLLGYSHCKN